MTVEQDSAAALSNSWPEIDRSLLGQTRPPAASFPLELLPGPWRTWAEACARSSIPIDYVAQASLAAVSALTGGRLYAEVTAEWYEPLILWQALVGGASAGKSPAMARARWLLRRVDPDDEADEKERLAPTVLADGTAAAAGSAYRSNARGVVLWHEGLADWLASANRTDERNGWLVGWEAGQLSIGRRSGLWSSQLEGFSVGILGTLRPERLASLFSDDEGDGSLAARFLYAWPAATSCVPLQGPAPDFDGMIGMLQRIARIAGNSESPGFVTFSPDAVARLDGVLPDLCRRTCETEDIEAAWIGKGARNIVRLACHFALMEWAQEPSDETPAVESRHVETAHRLWSSYYLPHALSVFGCAATPPVDRLARKAAAWLRRNGSHEVSREKIRRHALRRSVSAAEADDVIERLTAGNLLRAVPAPPNRGRPPLRWLVNPALRSFSGISAFSADDSIACVHTTTA
jgi:hypothetical protein